MIYKMSLSMYIAIMSTSSCSIAWRSSFVTVSGARNLLSSAT